MAEVALSVSIVSFLFSLIVLLFLILLMRS